MNELAWYIESRLENESIDDIYLDLAKKPSDLEYKIYKSIGVPLIRKILIKSVCKSVNYPTKFSIGRPSKKNLKKYVLETLKNEYRHKSPTFGFSSFSVVAAILGVYGVSTISFLLGVGHGYATMLQRYNRYKLMNIIEKREGNNYN